jgi:hypothetical protein
MGLFCNPSLRARIPVRVCRIYWEVAKAIVVLDARSVCAFIDTRIPEGERQILSHRKVAVSFCERITVLFAHASFAIFCFGQYRTSGIIGISKLT